MSQPRPQVPTEEPTYDPSRPFPQIQLLYKNAITNCPGMTIVASQVTFPPNCSTPPHTHAGAFVSVNIVSGYILNKMNDNPMHILGPGDTFSENPTCRHKICDNMSATEPATFVSTFILETKVLEEVGVEGLIVIDEEYREMVTEAKKRSSEASGGKV